MKRKLIYIIIGLVILFLTSIILSSIMIDSDFAFQISSGITMIYFISLTVITYIKNISTYQKTREFPKNSSLANYVFSISNGKLGIFIYTLFYISFWSFLGFLFYSFSFAPEGLNVVSETLLSISFVFISLAIMVILIFATIYNSKNTRETMKEREKEYQKFKNENELAYDLLAFKRHYAKPYYVLAYIAIFGLIFLLVGLIYNWVFDAYIVDVLGPTFMPIIYILIILAMFYLPYIFPIIIHTMKMNGKRQVITLNPLKIKMITKDGHDIYGNYEKVEKNFFVDKIYSYQMTNRYFIINGKIELFKHETGNYDSNKKSKEIKRLKIPRIFNNENILIDYLNNNLTK